jgi:GNAT superfamily N-acetyltransferase
MADLKDTNGCLNLLDDCFPGIKSNIDRCEKLGFPWKSKPFFKRGKDGVVAHVGCLDYPLFIEGRWHHAGALHAICTQAAHRGQGLASELIREALKWAESQYELVILFTEIPEFYERLSFQRIQEYRFHLTYKRPKGSLSLAPLTFPKENPLFIKCYQNRAPLSNAVWVKDNGAIASFNALFATYPTYWSLLYSPSINGIISFEIENKTLHLFDVICETIPSLDTLLDHMPSAIDEIYFYFSPDRLTNDASPEPYLFDSGHFLVHGNWPGTSPFMVAPLSRC